MSGIDISTLPRQSLRFATGDERREAAAALRWGNQIEQGTVNGQDRKSTRLNSSHIQKSRMPSSA